MRLRRRTANDAALLIDGGVRLAGDRARITAQLVDGASGHYLWSESFDLGLGRSRGLTGNRGARHRTKLRAEILATQSRRAHRRSSDNLAARNLYLQGRYHLNQRTEEGLHKAVDFFEKAMGRRRTVFAGAQRPRRRLGPARALRRAGPC